MGQKEPGTDVGHQDGTRATGMGQEAAKKGQEETGWDTRWDMGPWDGI